MQLDITSAILSELQTLAPPKRCYLIWRMHKETSPKHPQAIKGSYTRTIIHTRAHTPRHKHAPAQTCKDCALLFCQCKYWRRCAGKRHHHGSPHGCGRKSPPHTEVKTSLWCEIANIGSIAGHMLCLRNDDHYPVVILFKPANPHLPSLPWWAVSQQPNVEAQTQQGDRAPKTMTVLVAIHWCLNWETPTRAGLPEVPTCSNQGGS